MRLDVGMEPMGARGGQQARVCSPSVSRCRGANSGAPKGADTLDGAGHGEGMDGEKEEENGEEGDT